MGRMQYNAELLAQSIRDINCAVECLDSAIKTANNIQNDIPDDLTTKDIIQNLPNELSNGNQSVIDIGYSLMKVIFMLSQTDTLLLNEVLLNISDISLNQEFNFNYEGNQYNSDINNNERQFINDILNNPENLFSEKDTERCVVSNINGYNITFQFDGTGYRQANDEFQKILEEKLKVLPEDVLKELSSDNSKIILTTDENNANYDSVDSYSGIYISDTKNIKINISFFTPKNIDEAKNFNEDKLKNDLNYHENATYHEIGHLYSFKNNSYHLFEKDENGDIKFKPHKDTLASSAKIVSIYEDEVRKENGILSNATNVEEFYASAFQLYTYLVFPALSMYLNM